MNSQTELVIFLRPSWFPTPRWEATNCASSSACFYGAEFS